MFKEFLKLKIVSKLPKDCLDIIKKFYNSEIKKNNCVICNTNNVNYYDYIDGLGYICVVCNAF